MLYSEKVNQLKESKKTVEILEKEIEQINIGKALLFEDMANLIKEKYTDVAWIEYLDISDYESIAKTILEDYFSINGFNQNCLGAYKKGLELMLIGKEMDIRLEMNTVSFMKR